MLNNPFVVAGAIPDEYFCDRKMETERLVKSLVNGNNVVLISPRRMGKTGLIRHVFAQQEIRNNFYTIFVDILQTTSLKEFVQLLGMEIFSALKSSGSKLLMKFMQTLKSVGGSFGIDAITGSPTFNLQIGEVKNPEFTLDEIFEFLEKADRNCIVAIDEFQQIGKYKEANVEALLRSYIQKSAKGNFIFAGSERRMMQEMFLSNSRPFYNSADMMSLQPIPSEVYVEFAVENFRRFGKSVGREAVDDVYEQFDGVTYFLQRAMNEAFANTPDGGVCDGQTVSAAVDYIMETGDMLYREILSSIPINQKEVLIAIAKEGKARRVMSGEFLKRWHLPTASSVQNSIRRLIDRNLIVEAGGVYSVDDKLLGLWLRRQY